MSHVGVASRPATQMSQRKVFTPQLPEIQHPLSRLGNPDALNIGVRASSNLDRPSSQAHGRPLGAEQTYAAVRKLSSSQGRTESRIMRSRQTPQAATYESIPENIEVTIGDPTKTRLPIFGSRAGGESRANLISSHSRGGGSRASRPATQARLEIDELEALLREKVKANYFDIRKKFTNNDPEGKGNVSRDALFRIIVVTVSRPLTQNVFSRLMDRIGLKDKQVVNFNEFFSCFREVASREYPRWMDTINRANEKVTMTATQVHAQLKEKAKQRVLDVADIIPQINPEGARRLLKPEFRNALAKMMFYMEDTEFERLWKIYDSDNTGVINGENMMKKLGISIHGRDETSSPPPKSSRRTPSKPKEIERQRSLDIERWLKGKFREGFFKMKKEFQALDLAKSEWVSHDEFIEVINKFGLKLEKAHLDVFLARCGVTISKKGVPYAEFLFRFQDRSEAGMPHKILSDQKHRYNVSRGGTEGGKSTLSTLESRLMSMFQTDFLGLLATFHKIDKLGLDLVSQEEFRAAVESRFSLDMSDEQFSEFIEHVPLDKSGMVKYAEFMGVFDTKGKAKSLYAGGVPATPAAAPANHPSPRGLQEDTIENRVDRLVVNHDFPTIEMTKRPTHELFKIIKGCLSGSFQQIEAAFYEMDETNSQRMSQEMLYQLLQQTSVEPEITRGEVRDIWKTFITNADNKLEWLQFIRHFGHSLKSAAFPNAKLSPPKRGDSDFFVRSRKLNCAADMLQDNLRAKIDHMWEDLRREFVEMDPYNTGHVSKEEFCDVLTELCVHLTKYEQNMLVNKYNVNGDGRVSYIEFLKPFAMKKMHWKEGNNMLSLLSHPHAELPIDEIGAPPQKGLTGITSKLRHKLAGGEWKNLRRAFKKLDVNNDGYLSLPEFRSVLKLANVVLDEEEIFHVMDKFDEKLTGKVPYAKFLNETFKPETRQSTRMPVQQSL